MRPFRPRLIAALAATAAATLAGCSLGSPASLSPTGVATNPPVSGGTGTATATPAASGSAGVQTSGERTVLVQDGLRIHSSATLSAAVEGTAAWGVTLTVVGYDASGGPWPDSSSPGGWYQVEGSTVTGWIIADPTYTASGLLSSVGFQDKQIDGVLYPTDWTYSDNSGEVIFEPQTGTDLPTLVIREATTLSALGPAGLTGFASVSSNSEVVACGYTGTLVKYAAGPATSPQPTTDPGGGSVTRLADFAQFRATLSPSYAIDIEMNYSTADDFAVLENLLNSIRYPFPDCEAVTPTPTAG
ncbi:MAG: SH3 domain-containing protein [Candidatus Dormibacteria bacterium]